MKKKLLIIVMLLISFAIFAQAAVELQKESTTVFVDSLGRSVTVPKNITKVAPSGNVAQVQLYTIANDLMVGNSTFYSDNAKRYLKDTNVNLPTLGAFYGKKANLNKEALIVANPEVVIDFGEIKGSTEEMINDLDELQSQINIPVVFIESYLENTPASYRNLGKLLNREAEAEKLALFAEEAISIAKDKKAQITNPVTVYYSSAVDGLDAISKGNFHAEVIELVGGENVVPKSKGSGANIISSETLLAYNPEVILLSNNNEIETITTDIIYQSLDAVKNGKVFLLPVAPYPWIDSPPSVNRIIGIYYLGTILYPELYSDINLEEKVKEFYSLYYKYELTDAEVAELI